MSIKRGIDKEDMVYIENGILLSQKKENEIMLFAAQMHLEIIILNRESLKDHTIYHLYVESKI